MLQVSTWHSFVLPIQSFAFMDVVIPFKKKFLPEKILPPPYRQQNVEHSELLHTKRKPF